MRHRITIKQDTAAAGAEAPSYSNFKSDVPANVVDVRGQEKYRGYQGEATVDAVIEMHHIDGLNASMQILKQVTNDTYNISWMRMAEGRRRRILIGATRVEV
jgi:hypothetical protein